MHLQELCPAKHRDYRYVEILVRILVWHHTTKLQFTVTVTTKEYFIYCLLLVFWSGLEYVTVQQNSAISVTKEIHFNKNVIHVLLLYSEGIPNLASCRQHDGSHHSYLNGNLNGHLVVMRSHSFRGFIQGVTGGKDQTLGGCSLC